MTWRQREDNCVRQVSLFSQRKLLSKHELFQESGSSKKQPFIILLLMANCCRWIFSSVLYHIINLRQKRVCRLTREWRTSFRASHSPCHPREDEYKDDNEMRKGVRDIFSTSQGEVLKRKENTFLFKRTTAKRKRKSREQDGKERRFPVKEDISIS